jgi:hypothetical protein
MLNLPIKKSQKRWDLSLAKWRTDYIIINTIKLSIYEIARGYPARKHIIDKWYKPGEKQSRV